MKTKATKSNIKHVFIKRKKLFFRLGFGLVSVFVFINLATFILFLDRTYPQTFVSKQDLGVVRDIDIKQEIESLNLNQQQVKLTYKEQTIETKLNDIGISYDVDSIEENIKNDRSWLPILNYFQEHYLEFDISINEDTFLVKINSLVDKHQQKPQDAKIIIKDGKFEINDEATGHELNAKELKAQFVAQFKSSNESIQLPSNPIEPEVKAKDLKKDLEKLQSRQNLDIQLSFEGQAFAPSPEEIANWHIKSGNSFELSDQKIYSYINKKSDDLDASFSNSALAVSSIKQSVTEQKAANFSLLRAPVATTVNYCVAARGVSTNNLAGLSSKAKTVYDDSRGWTSTCKYRFQETTSGCSFVLWLAAADQMTSFSSACSSYWSCRVGVNVIINIDRWNNASPAWNQSGGSLDDYRSMVINHETGHWLGFGHYNCGGPGQLAPVMQQQSIDLQGCQFNPWPLDYELNQL